MTTKSIYHTEWTEDGPSVVERVIVDGKAYDIPYNNYSGPEGQIDAYMRTSYDSIADVTEPEYTVSDVYTSEQVLDRSEWHTPNDFPVLTGTYFGYAPNGDISQTCTKCNETWFWGGFAGDMQDFIILGMTHAYSHGRDARSRVAGEVKPKRVRDL